MSSNKDLSHDPAGSVAALVAALGAVIGVVSVDAHATDPPSTGTAVNATAQQKKLVPPKVNSQPVLQRGVAPASAAPSSHKSKAKGSDVKPDDAKTPK
jgi:hypothetical protein